MVPGHIIQEKKSGKGGIPGIIHCSCFGVNTVAPQHIHSCIQHIMTAQGGGQWWGLASAVGATRLKLCICKRERKSATVLSFPGTCLAYTQKL